MSRYIKNQQKFEHIQKWSHQDSKYPELTKKYGEAAQYKLSEDTTKELANDKKNEYKRL